MLVEYFFNIRCLSYVFGKDCATAARAETFADIGSNVPGGNEGIR